MEPRIQYARTSDEVNIAYSEAGEGKPLIVLPPATLSHAAVGWEVFAFLHPLANKFRTILLDTRGSGLSDRSAIDFSMEAMIRDIEAVVARAELESFVLAAWGSSVSVAVSYATANPERVSHLVLIDGFSRFSDFAESALGRALPPLLEMDWTVYTDTVAQVLWSHTNPAFARQFAEYMRACCEPEAARAAWNAWETYDVTGLLPRVTTPTLVVHNKRSRLYTLALGQLTAAGIPGARLALVDDVTYASLPELIEDFVFANETPPTSVPNLPSGTVIILFADIVDSTALTERLGDEAFRGKARDLDTSMRKAIRENAGTPIEGKTLGDGVLAVFTSAKQAIACAQACHNAATEAGLSLRAGIHAGDVIREADNVYGGAVNIAARIAAASAPGETLVSGTVRDLARTSAGVIFEDRGEQALKGIDGPTRMFAVSWHQR